MKGLYNRVMKGVYPKIPTHYSSDLSTIISSLLQIDPEKRPSCEQILHMPVFIAKHNEYRLKDPGDEQEEEIDHPINMLGTIKLPRNLKLVNLPKSNYESDDDKETKDSSRNRSQSQKNIKSQGGLIKRDIGLTEIKEVYDE